MRVATFRVDGRRRVGEVAPDGEAVRPFRLESEAGALPLIEATAAGQRPATNGTAFRLAQVALEAPIPRPRRNIFCVGKNYREHAHEFARSGFDSSAAAGAVPDAPIIFSKVPETVVGPGDPIRVDPQVSPAVDYEAELAVVIGKGGRGIRRAEALDHVWGYTIVNDVTARDLQGRHKQWLLGKSQDSFCPMGPWIVTRDEIDLADTPVRCWVNGELRQDANTRDLIFDVPTLIETISAGITLLPGDIIATGTPAGVGIGFKPPKYLKAGDVVRIEIGGIGVIENPVAARDAAV
ncbi:MAG TPA: fumarylacetoacetate hydrolase family protein [Methylomirabilota bacterium]|nr:fumarylacetoacetate hydrolase family protein [Methylomirabilota bacterium]